MTRPRRAEIRPFLLERSDHRVDGRPLHAEQAASASCVSSMRSPARSCACSSHRAARCWIEWKLLQATDCMTSASR